jgi:hypothetical protein
MLLAFLADTTTNNGATWQSYGVLGLVMTSVVLPMALIIRALYERQITDLKEERARLRSENAELRKNWENIGPAISDMSRTVAGAITVLDRIERGR